MPVLLTTWRGCLLHCSVGLLVVRRVNCGQTAAPVDMPLDMGLVSVIVTLCQVGLSKSVRVLCPETVYVCASVFFTALHGMQTRSSDENSVCPSVCLSKACIVTKRKKARFRFLYHTKEHLS